MAPAERKLTPGEIAAQGARAVVVLEALDEDGQRTSLGSGFAYAPDGVVVSNYHVIRGAARVTVRTSGADLYEAGSVLAFSPERDVAALKIRARDLPVLPVGRSESLKTAHHVVALGAPLGLQNSLSDGLVSAVRELGNVRIIQTTAPISPGSSGGPLLEAVASP